MDANVGFMPPVQQGDVWCARESAYPPTPSAWMRDADVDASTAYRRRHHVHMRDPAAQRLASSMCACACAGQPYGGCKRELLLRCAVRARVCAWAALALLAVATVALTQQRLFAATLRVRM
ncbi:hypothetical protein EON66_11620 [archaeon]|nr:MAG: hypothetical protein EON66_11620 [archaeon]